MTIKRLFASFNYNNRGAVVMVAALLKGSYCPSVIRDGSAEFPCRKSRNHATIYGMGYLTVDGLDLVFIILSLVIIGSVALLPSSELASLQFLIQQYGQSQLPQMDQSICNKTYSGWVFCTTDSNGVDHISAVCKSSKIRSTKVNFFVNFTDQWSPECKIGGDETISSIPSLFPKNLPALSEFAISDIQDEIYSNTFFNNSNISVLKFDQVIFSGVTIDESLYLPKLTKLQGLALIANPPINLNFQSNSFPLLEFIGLEIEGFLSVITVNSSKIKGLSINRSFGSSNVIIGPNLNSSLENIQLSGSITFTGDLKDCIHLKNIYLSMSSLNSYPFTAFPTALEALTISGASFNTKLPTLPIPSNLTTFILSNSDLVGNLPHTVFQNAPTGFKLGLDNNQNLVVGDIPEYWCQFGMVNVENTIVNSAPECFQCYYGNGDTSIKIGTAAAPQPPFTCNITFVRYNLVSIMKIASVYFGLVCGWSPSTIQFNILPLGYKKCNIYNGRGCYFNSFLTHLVQFTKSNTICTVFNQTSNSLTCLLPKTTPISPNLSLNISNQYHSIISTVNLVYYPIVSSADYLSDNQTLTFYGYYGPPDFTPLIVTVAGTINCNATSINETTLQCKLASTPQPGPATLFVSVGGFEFTSSNLLYFQPNNNNGSTTGSTTTNGGETPQQKCSRLTYNCYGHGYCDTNGICQCDENYNQIDNCLTKYINTTIKPNTTNPTVSFDIDGIDFQFEIYSIQELDYDGSILQELLLTNQTWNVSINTDNITTLANYQLILGNDSMYQSLLVSSDISFSSIQRNVTFGDTELVLAPNAIKIGFTINGWSYQSNLATLRVVFKSIMNNDQSILFDCEKQSIDSFTKEELSESIQYLRVVKNNIQFNGRFIDFVLSDGRKTYSKTELISLTPTNDNTNGDEQSIVLIGINLPQCQSCQLDPDFTPLLIDKNNDNNECSSQSNTWKIIVGTVAGGIGLVALTIATVILIKKKVKSHKYHKDMAQKLNQFK
ncbi:hypothetical protein DFA_08818 [Cavenderia fasciculata]|uniref:ComC supersandwich domain-containing protein n=1 Tax=Cavenderia fasciculata TaxID=261658 RepID=F4Q4G8_CACFS|nr:uncharacterized protein DFA_08818 [Cavenderia fasciculata]EGG17817.1 hypothetical protein DFA_08818 [Cavenderia fasciculata]|eukprot:XP_004356301.1 hypothetical protein DFA_08818 [Cavenderia fasciculata]